MDALEAMHALSLRSSYFHSLCSNQTSTSLLEGASERRIYARELTPAGHRSVPQAGGLAGWRAGGRLRGRPSFGSLHGRFLPDPLLLLLVTACALRPSSHSALGLSSIAASACLAQALAQVFANTCTAACITESTRLQLRVQHGEYALAFTGPTTVFILSKVIC